MKRISIKLELLDVCFRLSDSSRRVIQLKKEPGTVKRFWTFEKFVLFETMSMSCFGPRLPADDAEEVNRLRRENQKLRRELRDANFENFAGSGLFGLFGPTPKSRPSKMAKIKNALMKPFRCAQTNNSMRIQDMANDNVMNAFFPNLMFDGLMKEFASQDSHEDIKRVQKAALRSVELDSTASSILGTEIAVDAPFSKMTSTSKVNGVTKKEISLRMPVKGSVSQVHEGVLLFKRKILPDHAAGLQGTLTVTATIDDANVTLQQCSVQVNRQDIKIIATPSDANKLDHWPFRLFTGSRSALLPIESMDNNRSWAAPPVQSVNNDRFELVPDEDRNVFGGSGYKDYRDNSGCPVYARGQQDDRFYSQDTHGNMTNLSDGYNDGYSNHAQREFTDVY